MKTSQTKPTIQKNLRDSSICKELHSKGTQTTLDLQLILKRNTDQANLIFALQEKNSELLAKPRVKISTITSPLLLQHFFNKKNLM